MRILVVSTPVGPLGSGRGGGVELTATALVAGLLGRGHQITVLAPGGSRLPPSCAGAILLQVPGEFQPSCQHQDKNAPIVIANDGVLAGLWRQALAGQGAFEVILNLAYDWLPLWLTPHTQTPLAHLVSMGSVGKAMDSLLAEISRLCPANLAFHTASQAADFDLGQPPRLVGNGFDLDRYQFVAEPLRQLGWAGRIAPEKGLEDAAWVAAQLGLPLQVWGYREDGAYADAVEASVPAGTLCWRGFMATEALQAELGRCLLLLNTPKWNEAFGNVVVEAMACGVPVAAYARGGPAELVQEGLNGALCGPDDRQGLVGAAQRAMAVDRASCRAWVERHACQAAFAARIEAWLLELTTG